VRSDRKHPDVVTTNPGAFLTIILYLWAEEARRMLNVGAWTTDSPVSFACERKLRLAITARSALGLITIASALYLAWYSVRLEDLPPFVIRWIPKVN
jgi:hypothetical protein